MLTPEGCRQRRQRLWQRLDPKPDSDHLRLADPIHLMYLANFYVTPFSLGAGFGGYLFVVHGSLVRPELDEGGAAKIVNERGVELESGPTGAEVLLVETRTSHG